ncbi:hypothetical protein [Pseudonocardia acaciae]|uniref:hypothetical protein n=1 Tax=Pseudonocardia acaciae TaxID=551276 RepID=UPI0012EE923A|nr:hypothetical protein [Pseudonocardia acaciae]
MSAGAEIRRPDRFGEPRPPAAPRSGMSYRYPVRALHLDPRAPSRRWRRIGPPDRPALELVLVPTRAQFATAAVESSPVALLCVGAFGWAAWVDVIPVWVAVVLGLGLVGLTVLWRWLVSDASAPVAAGADWVGTSALWVPLYELTLVEAEAAQNGDGDDIAGTVALALWHGPETVIVLDMALLQSNPALWDLVHQGVLASIAAGAELTEDARQALRQP